MKRTRKWAFVAQEANRLAALGLSAAEITKRLGVNRSTLTRWMQAGKLSVPGSKSSKRGRPRRPKTLTAVQSKTAAEWAAAVRTDYALDVTDDQMVTMAESALLLSRDPAATPALRLNAMGRFQAIVKQLALVARSADAKSSSPPEPPARVVNPPVRRTAGDPRALLTAVK